MATGNQGVSASRESGEPVEVRNTNEGDSDPGVQTGAESRLRMEDARATDVMNPLGEPEINVRVREGFEFYHQGELRRSGDEFPMAITQARAASMYVDEVTEDGRTRAVPHEQQQTSDVPRANLAGMARHERIGALEAEERSLAERLERVRSSLEHERRAADAERKEPAAPAARPTPEDVNRPGAAAPVRQTTANTATPSRPAEAATGSGGPATPAQNSGEPAKK